MPLPWHLDKPFFVKGHEYGETCSAPVSSVCFKGKFQKSLFSSNFKHLNGGSAGFRTVVADFDYLSNSVFAQLDTECGLCSLAGKSVGFAD